MSDVLMNKDEIKKVIPHREPMLMIDEILEIEAKVAKVNEAKAVVTCEAVVYNNGEVSTIGLVTLAMR